MNPAAQAAVANAAAAQLLVYDVDGDGKNDVITFQGVLVAGMDHSKLANVAAGLFILPFFLFSATAGQLADKYDKAGLIRRVRRKRRPAYPDVPV